MSGAGRSLPALALAVLLCAAPVTAPAADAPRSLAQAPAIAAGVPLTLARWRSAHYRDLRYRLEIAIEPGASHLAGVVELTLSLGDTPVDLVLDWKPADDGGRSLVRDLRVNGQALADAFIGEEHIVVPAARLRPGENLLRMHFVAPIAAAGAAVTRYLDREDGGEYLYSLLVPADARTLFPCIDQPDLKARFTLDLTLPADWQAVGNAPLEARAAAGEGRARYRFAPTEPISTYLFAFAAGPFAAIEETPAAARERRPGGATTNHAGPPPVRLFVRRSQAARAAADAAETLRLNRAALGYYRSYFGHPYPFAKYDLVLIPEFAYGGMEHAGATFLREETVLPPSTPSNTDLLRRAQLVFHETAHQWFGNLVTMRWFDDLWLKEGFANFMAAKATEALAPQFDAWTAFHQLKLHALRTDATRGATPIRQEIANLADAKSAYGAIVYSKAPAVLRQAEFYLGQPAFERAVRAFVRQHAYGAADWADLVRAFERASGRNLQGWADAWVQRRGAPVVRVEAGVDPRGRITQARVVQRHSLDEPGVWPMRIAVGLIAADGSARPLNVLLDGNRAPLPRLAGTAAPRLLYPNLGDRGYGRFLLDAEGNRAARALLPSIREPLLRAQLIEALWEGVREAEVAPLEFIDLALVLAPRESDEVILTGLIQRLDWAVRRTLSDAQRNRIAARLERTLLDGLAQATDPRRGVVWLRALIDLAASEDARAAVKRLLAERADLGSRERFRAIRRLLMLADPEAPALLERQSALDTSDDGRRYAYAAAAARADASAKRALFERWLSADAPAESWIEEALAPFNAPEHAALTAPLVARALDALPELGRRRKIFFVNHWLESFLGGQTDAATLAEIERWRAANRLAPDLALKLDEALDTLERVARIRAKFAAQGEK